MASNYAWVWDPETKKLKKVQGEVPGVTKLVQVRPPRLLKPCDVARMAREVVKNGYGTPEEVMACIAKGFGFSHVATKKTKEEPVKPVEGV